MSAGKNKRPEEICQILISRANDSKYQRQLDELSKYKNWDKNGLNKQIEHLTYLCELIQEEDKTINNLLESIRSVNQMQMESQIKSTKPILGIDLGTSRSTIGYFKINARGRSELEIVANQQGSRSNPSVICIYKDKVYFGDDAIKISAKCPENLIYDTKRMFGHKFNDPFIQYMKKYWTFNITGSEKGDILIEVDNKKYRPYEISSMILTALMNLANSHLKDKTNQAIITVPAYFTEKQRDETKKAAEKAGIKLLELVEEPKAATFCYGFKTEDAENSRKSRDILVYDFGGGTLDISYVEIKGSSFNVLATAGDSFLGGQDFTNCLFDYISPCIDEECNKNWRNEKRFVSYVKSQCDEAKIYLSDQNDHDFYLDIPPKLQKDRKNCIEFKITRKQFENAAKNLFERCMNPVIEVIKRVGRDPQLIDGLVLIGGSSYLPLIRNKLKEITHKEAFHGVCPVEAVAYGACTIAAKYFQCVMPKYNKGNTNVDGNERFLSNISVQENCQSSIEIEKFKNGSPYFVTLIEEFTPLPASEEILIYSNDVQIYKNTKEIFLRVFEKKDKNRKYLGDIKFDISQYNFSSQNVPLVNIKLTLSISGIVYATQKPSGKLWSHEKKLEIVENSNQSKKKKNDTLSNEELTPLYHSSVDTSKSKGPLTLNNDIKPKSVEYQHSRISLQQNNEFENERTIPQQQISRSLPHGNEQNQQYYNHEFKHETFTESNRTQNQNRSYLSSSERLGLTDPRYRKNDFQ